jgi:hypothetical protein
VGTKYVNVAFSFRKCTKEVDELGELLKTAQLSEKNDILPFFKTRNHLCAFMGTFAPDIGPAPIIAREFSFLGDFTADLFVGNRANRQYKNHSTTKSASSSVGVCAMIGVQFPGFDAQPKDADEIFGHHPTLFELALGVDAQHFPQ